MQRKGSDIINRDAPAPAAEGIGMNNAKQHHFRQNNEMDSNRVGTSLAMASQSLQLDQVLLNAVVARVSMKIMSHSVVGKRLTVSLQ